jgi:TatD DNase family protein
MNSFVDTHCHLDTYEEQTQESFESLWAKMEVKPEAMIQVACDPHEFEYAKIMSEKYDFIYAAYGVHPQYVDSYRPEHEELLKSYLVHPKAVACGEFGLDYHYGAESKEAQCLLFEKELEIGLQKGKPLVLHLREAEKDSLSILRNAPIQNHPIHVHCFTGTPAFAEALLKLSSSIYIGFTGIISFKNAENVRAAAKIVPLERLLLETDAPYLAPVPFRGKPAHSGMIPLIAEHLAQVKNITKEELLSLCRENTRQCYHI